MQKIEWLTRGKVSLPDIDPLAMEQWLEEVARRHNRIVGELTYIFCDDDTILETNRDFLQHDYYTDIITFDYTRGRLLRGDMFISLDTVASNAALFGQDYERELRRVIVHGVLHLCGIDDKGPGEREVMEAHEEAALSIINY